MRVCLVSLDFPPFRTSGLTVYAENLARGLAERGHSITVIAADRYRSGWADRVPVPDYVRIVRVPVGHLDWMGLGWQAARYLYSHRDEFDVVHFLDVHFAYAYHGRFVASGFHSFRQRLTGHNGGPYHLGRLDYLFRVVYYTVARYAMEQPSLRRAAHILMSSHATRCEFVRYYQVEPARTTIIYPGIDLQRFQELPERAEARRLLGLPLEVSVLLYVGFSTPRKGLDYLAQAFKLLRVPSYLVMVGAWARNYQRRFLAALGHARQHVRLTGYVPDTDILAYFAAADLFVFPTLLEGFGIPLVEAMAAGLPIVTTSGGAAGEVVGDAGLVVSPADSRALAYALEQVLSDPVLARRLSENGIARACKLFDMHGTARAVESVYRSILKL